MGSLIRMLRCSAEGGFYSPKRSAFRPPRGGQSPLPIRTGGGIQFYYTILGGKIKVFVRRNFPGVYARLFRPRHCRAAPFFCGRRSVAEERRQKPARRFVSGGRVCFVLSNNHCIPPVQPRLMSRAPSTFRMVERGREPMRSFSRRLSSVRICSSRMTESFCSP